MSNPKTSESGRSGILFGLYLGYLHVDPSPLWISKTWIPGVENHNYRVQKRDFEKIFLNSFDRGDD